MRHRLRQQTGDAQGSATRGTASRHRGRKHHHSRVCQFRLLFNLFRQSKAVHFRHDRVEQHELIGRIGLGCAQHLVQTRLTRFDESRTHPPVHQHLAQDAAIYRIVVHHQRAQARQVARVRVLYGRRGRVAHAKTGRKMEGGSFAHFAFNPDLAVHFVNEVRGDRKPQTGAAMSSRRRTVRLRERCENRVLFVSWNADAGIGDGKMQLPLTVGCHLHDDRPTLGELDRVSGEVDQDLAQPHRIAH